MSRGRVVMVSILGSTDGFSIPAYVDDVADDVIWSPLRCGCDDPMGVPDAAAAAVFNCWFHLVEKPSQMCLNCIDSH